MEVAVRNDIIYRLQCDAIGLKLTQKTICHQTY